MPNGNTRLDLYMFLHLSYSTHCEVCPFARCDLGDVPSCHVAISSTLTVFRSLFSSGLINWTEFLTLSRTWRRWANITEISARIAHHEASFDVWVDNEDAILAILLTVSIVLIHAVSYHHSIWVFVREVV